MIAWLCTRALWRGVMLGDWSLPEMPLAIRKCWCWRATASFPRCEMLKFATMIKRCARMPGTRLWSFELLDGASRRAQASMVAFETLTVQNAELWASENRLYSGHDLRRLRPISVLKILDFRGCYSSNILISRVGILMPVGDFPEMLSQRILAGIILAICIYIYIYVYIYIHTYIHTYI